MKLLLKKKISLKCLKFILDLNMTINQDKTNFLNSLRIQPWVPQTSEPDVLKENQALVFILLFHICTCGSN